MKIFGIGLSRTGTTSLAYALEEVGFDVLHYPNENLLFSPNNDGACDIPVAAHYKELDRKFPNSKFIYTIREQDDWLNSVEKYLERKKGRKISAWQMQNRIAVYGRTDFNRDVFAAAYDKHDNDIREYFVGREQDLLITNICAGDSMRGLVSFVGAESDISTFPHKNKRNI